MSGGMGECTGIPWKKIVYNFSGWTCSKLRIRREETKYKLSLGIRSRLGKHSRKGTSGPTGGRGSLGFSHSEKIRGKSSMGDR